MKTPPHGISVVIVTFIIAMIMMLLPLPDFLVWWRPNWLLMVLIYWTMALPHRVGILTGWSVGLMTDVALGSVLGVHGLTMAVIAYLIILLTNRLRLFPLWKQSAIIALMVGLDLVMNLWIQNFISMRAHESMYWLPIISSAFFWPWYFSYSKRSTPIFECTLVEQILRL